MKVLRVLALVFGILLLLTGGGLLLGASAADKGQDSVQQEIAKQGLKGPVDATVVSEENSTYTVTFTAEDGQSYTATAVSTLSTPPKVGDTVSVFYKAEDPTVAAITDAPVNALSGVAGTLRTGGIVTLVVGGLLLVAGILGFVLGKKTPKPVPGQPYAAAYPGQGAPGAYPAPGAPNAYPGNGAPGGYPAQGAPNAYPGQGGAPAPYPQQGGPAAYPAQGARQTYPAQGESGSYPAQPGGNSYPSGGGTPGAYPTQGGPAGYPTPPGTPSAPTPPQQYPPQQ